MHIGATIFATDLAIPVTRLAPELEARGYESLWVPEKTHLPTSRRTAWPGGELPPWYLRTCDPLVTLSAAAALTTRLRVGTGVSLLPVHDAVTLAKSIATLDWQSGGRFEYGVGYGWNAEEFATHGVALADAPAILREKLELMQALWTQPEASYHGRHVAVDPCWSWPKPVQQPRPPVHIGARATAAVFGDIARHGDGWMPIEGYGDVLRHLPALRAAFAARGRDPAAAVTSVFAAAADPARLADYAAAGVQRVILALPSADTSTVLKALDAMQPVVAAWS